MPKEPLLRVVQLILGLGAVAALDGPHRNGVGAFRDGRRAGLPSMFDLLNVELWLRSLASEEVRCAA